MVRSTTVHEPGGQGLGGGGRESLWVRRGVRRARGARRCGKDNGGVKLFEDLALRDNMALVAAPLALTKIGFGSAWRGVVRG